LSTGREERIVDFGFQTLAAGAHHQLEGLKKKK
jgi:hypothetical protein